MEDDANDCSLNDREDVDMDDPEEEDEEEEEEPEDEEEAEPKEGQADEEANEVDEEAVDPEGDDNQELDGADNEDMDEKVKTETKMMRILLQTAMQMAMNTKNPIYNLLIEQRHCWPLSLNRLSYICFLWATCPHFTYFKRNTSIPGVFP